MTKLMMNAIISLDLSKGDIMDKMTIKEFKDKSNIEIIESIMKINNGYVTSNEISLICTYLYSMIYFGIHQSL